MKIKNKMILGSSLLAALPVILASVVLDIIAVETSSEALETQVSNQLIALRESKKTQIEDYFKTIYSQLLNMAGAPAVQYGMREFPPAFRTATLGGDDVDIDIEQLRSELSSYYLNDYANEYKNQNSGRSVDAKALVNGLSDSAVALQHSYIYNNQHPLGSKNNLVNAGTGNRYDALHRNNHPFFNDFISRFGYYDLFLVSPDGYIVYSVYKELDYATNLINGPYADSGIARAYKAAMKADAGKVVIDDFAPYTPSYDGPASFAATPVFEDGERLGVLILQMPINNINAIMTSNEKWTEVGLGESGETYLVGDDKKARSASRFLIEDAEGYKSMMLELGESQELVDTMMAKGTNIGL